ncbi:hypothetical protein G6F46_006897 [Rhizopus delemar]|uniref:Uncharacterized protein n=2 Tax=Rhizopus TaxID=4842 RepID=A0A9P6ZCR3_9FUNG|nr:hypothetical protein G6F36_013259 [Rhizopus arrhizus]KAG1455471.1 hypothetical protein G6F55_007050 [Rhizopus delemar]KAG1494344.1 hypothetical protein G6F54_007942 [Rhizopus delemar]KAG1508174.1 hypothetical protein G6F53_008393 [Rhizopus delemar]KAG1523893.1 hypothetical protein G6F52_004642 [Rhizopus delemar]
MEDYVEGDVSDDIARIQLLRLCRELKDEECYVIQAIVELIPSFYDHNMKILSETDISFNCVHPLIHGFFSSKLPSKVAHCSNLMVDEQETSNKKLLDYKIDAYESYEYAYIFAYGGNQNKQERFTPGYYHGFSPNSHVLQGFNGQIQPSHHYWLLGHL